MLRNIGGVIVGYITLALLIFLTYSAAYLLMGANAAFKPATYEPSVIWLVSSFVLGFLASVVAGYVCASIAGGKRTPIALAALVIVLGVLTAIPVFTAANEAKRLKPRMGDVSNIEAMQNAVLPTWVALLNPFIGAVGVLAGASIKRKSKE